MERFGMLELLDQITMANDHGLHYLALMATLAVPDMCAALASQSGESTGGLYKQWVDSNMTDSSRQGLSSHGIYRLRCSILHQGSGFHDGDELERVMFAEPGGPVKISASKAIHIGEEQMSTHIIDLLEFCQAVNDAARRWLKSNVVVSPVKENLERIIRRHPNGIPPFIVGIPTIG